MTKNKKAAEKKYSKPQEKKEEFAPQIKKCKKLNSVICTCGVVYGNCGNA